jgi:hypothetical protein
LRPLKLFLIAGEHSGDALGAKLIEALRTQSARPIEFQGVGGELMEEQGCPSLFPLSELAVMSLVDVLPRLPNIWRRIRQSVDAVIAQSPDALVIPDSPEFTHQVAKRAAGGRRKFRSSTMSRRASGPGGLAGRARCAVMSITSSPFCPSSRKRIAALAARLAAMSVIRWSRSSIG